MADAKPASAISQSPKSWLEQNASRTVLSNVHIASIVFHDGDYYRSLLRRMQGTYVIKQLHLGEQGLGFQIRMTWDHDRLFGVFELGYFSGVFVVDPAPGQLHFFAEDVWNFQHRYDEGAEEIDFKTPEKREYPFVWRGKSSQLVDTVFGSPLTVGKIRFGDGEIWVHFDFRPAVGFPYGRHELHGKKPFGPSIVSISIQEAVDKWNSYNSNVFNTETEAEVPRYLNQTPKVLSSEYCNQRLVKAEHIGEIPHSDLPQPVPKIKKTVRFKLPLPSNKHTKAFWKLSIGIFDITSSELQSRGCTFPNNLGISFHVDEEQDTVWGVFNIGIVEGFIRLRVPPGYCVSGRAMKFEWRGKEIESRLLLKGRGEVTILGSGVVLGIFVGNVGEIDFKGTRNEETFEVDGTEDALHRNGWKDHAPL